MIQWKIETKLMNKSHLPREELKRNEWNWSLNIRMKRLGGKGVWGMWWKWKEWVVILRSGRGDGVTSKLVTASRSIFPLSLLILQKTPWTWCTSFIMVTNHNKQCLSTSRRGQMFCYSHRVWCDEEYSRLKFGLWRISLFCELQTREEVACDGSSRKDYP